jgi:hypothetical protein
MVCDAKTAQETFRRRTLIAAAGLIIALGAASTGQATVITQMLGTANYTNSQTVGDAVLASNPSGDPAPFDRLIGNKATGPNPSTSFTFASYGGPIASPISSATLEFGLYDAASPSPSTEVQFFTLNGIDNASVLTAALVADPATRSVETYYTLNLPGTDFAALATGSSTFALGFQGQGEGLLGPSPFILFGLDFATLTINTGPTPPIPEPPAILLLLTGLGGLVAFTSWIRRQPNQPLVKA